MAGVMSNAAGPSNSVNLRATASATACDLLSNWPVSAEYSVSEVLRLNPEVRGRDSVIVELAYEEFCRSRDEGRTLDAAEFAARFPRIESQLRDLLLLDQLLGDAELSRKDGAILPREGDVISGLRIVRLLGRGGFSNVYLAEQVGLGGRRIALKVSYEASGEGALLAELDHPNIVKVHHEFYDDTRHCRGLVMEFVDADPSSTPAARSRILSFETFATQLAGGLAHAHDRRLVHGDLKPANVLVDQSGRPKLIDFNLGSRRGDGIGLGGTLPFMAPEQLLAVAEGRHVPADARTDVYGYAATLACILSGRSLGSIPAGETPAAIAESLLSRGPLWPQAVHESVQGGRFRRLLSDCLCKTPELRPRDADQLHEALRSLARRRQSARRAAAVLLFGASAALAGERIHQTTAEKIAAASVVVAEDPAEAGSRLRGVEAAAIDDWRLLVAAANDALDRADYHAAMPYLEAALCQGESSELLELAGFADLQTRGNIPRAVARLRAARRSFEAGPSDRQGTGVPARLLNNLGVGYRILGDLAPAEAAFAKANAVNVDDDAAHKAIAFNRAWANIEGCIHRGEQPDLELVDEALLTNPSHPLIADLRDLADTLRHGVSADGVNETADAGTTVGVKDPESPSDLVEERYKRDSARITPALNRRLALPAGLPIAVLELLHPWRP